MTPCDTLADVRSAIDQIDAMLVGLLAERRPLMLAKPPVSSTTRPRWRRRAASQQVIDRALRHARAMGAEPAVVEAVYRDMITSFIELEATRHEALQERGRSSRRNGGLRAASACQPLPCSGLH
ncbi:MAG: chorismate mutase [Aquabacterium sp.]